MGANITTRHFIIHFLKVERTKLKLEIHRKYKISGLCDKKREKGEKILLIVAGTGYFL